MVRLLENAAKCDAVSGKSWPDATTLRPVIAWTPTPMESHARLVHASAKRRSFIAPLDDSCRLVLTESVPTRSMISRDVSHDRSSSVELERLVTHRSPNGV